MIDQPLRTLTDKSEELGDYDEIHQKNLGLEQMLGRMFENEVRRRDEREWGGWSVRRRLFMVCVSEVWSQSIDINMFSSEITVSKRSRFVAAEREKVSLRERQRGWCWMKDKEGDEEVGRGIRSCVRR